MALRGEHKLVRFRFLRALRQVRRLCPEEHRRVIEFTVTEARHLLDHNEGAVGLEILISNLAEVSFPTPAPLLAELRWLTGRFLIGPLYVALLDTLQAEPDAAPDRRDT